MNTDKPLNCWPNTEALLWLGQILSERYGHSFLLESSDPGKTLIKLPGEEGCVEIVIDPITFNQRASDMPCQFWNPVSEGWGSTIDSPLPMPTMSNDLPELLIERQPDGYRVNFDILGFSYWMLARVEEIDRVDLDGYQRFPATASHGYKHGYLKRPVVDEWLNILAQLIANTWPHIQLKTSQFEVKVSHDVDCPSLYGFSSPMRLLRNVVASVIKRRDVKALFSGFFIRMNTKETLYSKDPFNTFDWIMDISERHGLKSAFYFICGRTDRRKDAEYELEHPAIRDLLRRIHKRGHEVGLHPSFNTYMESQKIVQEASRLRRVCEEEGVHQSHWGGRMHYLRWKQPVTLIGWEVAGMSYDSTLGYADMAGFRCGTCFEYLAFDPIASKKLNLRIRPLIVMECTVIANRYMGLGHSDNALKEFMLLKNACQSVNGTFTILWHNSQLVSSESRFLYQTLLEKCCSANLA